MAYTNALSVVRVTGIFVDVDNELLGIGDGTLDSYDFANGNIIASSYSILYGEPESNDLTELTETTHYTIDKDGGSLLLTSAGVTAVDKKNIYATYTHSPKASNTVLESYIPAAEKEVDKLTGNYWGTQTSTTEFFDWELENKYPTTDTPYINDYSPQDELKLKYRGITSITGFYALGQNVVFSTAFRYDSVGDTYTSVIDSINISGGTGFQPFADTTAANDYLYLGSSRKFLGFHTLLYTNGVTAGTNTIEYYNGSSWVAISSTESATGVLNFATNGKVSWSGLQDWTRNSVNGSSSLYYVRIKANAVYSTEALINLIYIDQDSVIERDIPLNMLKFDAEGRIVVGTKLPNGKRNIRVDYLHGYTTTPADIQELTDLLIGLRIFAGITGGSYDDVTMFTLGRKTVSIGEVYVNVREVVKQLQERINMLLPGIGRTLSAC